MATKTKHDPADDVAFDRAGATIIDKDLSDEAKDSFLEYAYSVIHSRALPDARDGLKPVHRRILFGMSELNLRPDHAYVKSARVVGEVMGRLHPHGDSAIYEAMVRLAQDFSLNTPLVDGHGNFGSPNDGPAASRYTECRMAPYAMYMVGELGEGTVDFTLNYDGSLEEPTVLPAAFPNLLVNGGTGIAVGMTTNMIPHNLGEVLAATRHLLAHPDATLADLMERVPGPDLPTGGQIVGMDEVLRAYTDGKGTIRIRAKASIEPLEGSRGRSAIIVTELPYGVGTERIIEKLKDEAGAKRLVGISDVKDLSDRRHGTRLVIECKTGVNPSALLAELYRLTPMEVSFGITNLALVKGQPKLLGLKELLEVFLSHRLISVTRRTQFRYDKAAARAHLVEGLLIALDAIDAVVKTIKASKDTAAAKTALMSQFKLSDIQATYVLDMPLRRLVNLEVTALRDERADLEKTMAALQKILSSDKELRRVLDGEFAAMMEAFPTPRRTELIDGDLKAVLAASQAITAPLTVSDDPTTIVLSATGLIGRTPAASEESTGARGKRGRAKHDAILGTVPTTARGQFLAVTSAGRAFRLEALDIPSLPDATGTLTVAKGMPASDIGALLHGETVVGICGTDTPIAMGTKRGTVKVAAADWPTRSNLFDIMSLEEGDEVVSAFPLAGEAELVFLTSDAQLLHFPAASVRPQGRSGGGMAGIRLAEDAQVVAFAAVPAGEEAFVVTATGVSAKCTPLSVYPGKGRATGGVRAHTFRKGESAVVAGHIGPNPVAVGYRGEPIDLPAPDPRRDASGSPLAVTELRFGFALTRE